MEQNEKFYPCNLAFSWSFADEGKGFRKTFQRLAHTSFTKDDVSTVDQFFDRIRKELPSAVAQIKEKAPGDDPKGEISTHVSYIWTDGDYTTHFTYMQTAQGQHIDTDKALKSLKKAEKKVRKGIKKAVKKAEEFEEAENE